MIWSRGEIIPSRSLGVSVLDQSFEHGLGLFETFRTWTGRARALTRHLDRLTRSAQVLDLPLDQSELPREADVLEFREALDPGGEADFRFRLTITGGLSSSRPGGGFQSVVWMSAGPLPDEITPGARMVRTILADPGDPLLRHKTLNYWRRRLEQARAAAEGADEVLCVTPGGLICEGTRSNIFLVQNGRLITPAADGPLLAGVMRGIVIERAREHGIPVVEEAVPMDTILGADEAFLTNAVRGILPLGRLLQVDLPAPGPLTRRLRDLTESWLAAGAQTA